MENPNIVSTPSPPVIQSSSNTMEWTWQNMAIVLLIVLLLFSFLGINLLTVFGNVFQQFANLVIPFIERVLNILGFTLGSFANISADVIEDVGKSSLTIFNDGVHDITGLIMDEKKPEQTGQTGQTGQTEVPYHTHPVAPVQTDHLEKDMSQGPVVDVSNGAVPSSSSSPMQTSIAATSKSSWCLTGEYKERRGCIEIGENDRCMSGQVFPTQALCLNPNIQPYQ